MSIAAPNFREGPLDELAEIFVVDQERNRGRHMQGRTNLLLQLRHRGCSRRDFVLEPVRTLNDEGVLFGPRRRRRHL